MNTHEKSTQFLTMIGLLLIVLATVPIFFDIYRTAAFNTVPHDDYASYLLVLVGEGNKWPGAPFVYRILSVCVAIPFYYILPLYTFSHLQNANPIYLRAVMALSFSSYVWITLTPIVIYLTSWKKYHATKHSALIVAFSTFLMSGFVSKVGVDPFAIFIISVLIFNLNKKLFFALLIILSIGINEKIPIIFAVILTFRLMAAALQKRKFAFYVQLLFSYLAIIGYILIVFFFRIPGNENQTNPFLFLMHLQSSIIYSSSLKGIVLNVLPILVLLLAIILAVKYRDINDFQVADIAGLFVLVVLAMIADVVYNIGRIAMYSYPLYIPAIGAYIDNVLSPPPQK